MRSHCDRKFQVRSDSGGRARVSWQCFYLITVSVIYGGRLRSLPVGTKHCVAQLRFD